MKGQSVVNVSHDNVELLSEVRNLSNTRSKIVPCKTLPPLELCESLTQIVSEEYILFFS